MCAWRVHLGQLLCKVHTALRRIDEVTGFRNVDRNQITKFAQSLYPGKLLGKVWHLQLLLLQRYTLYWVELWQSHRSIESRSRSPGHSICLKCISRKITVHGFALHNLSPGVLWWLSGSSSRCHRVVCSLWLWYFLIILTIFDTHSCHCWRDTHFTE